MTSPFTGGSATLKSEKITLRFRNEEFEVSSYYYECDETGLHFSDAELDQKAMDEVYSLYRERHNIPSPSELLALRERYGLSGHTMSKILGIGVNQYGLYEKGEMPTASIGQMLSAIMNHGSFLQAVKRAHSKLGNDYQKILDKVSSYNEPKKYIINAPCYSGIKDFCPREFKSLAYPIKKSRWATVSVQ